MAIPLAAALSATARAALPIIKAGVARGLSSRAIQDTIRAGLGRGIRRQTLFDLIRAEKAIDRAGAALRFVGLDKMPNVARLPRSITRLRRRYSFVVRVTGQLLDAGVTMNQHNRVHGHRAHAQRDSAYCRRGRHGRR